MIPEEDINNKLKSRKGFLTSDSTGESSKKVLPDWNSLYTEMEVEDMPWYLPELDPDLKESLIENHIQTGSFLDLGTGPGTQAIGLSKMGFEVTGTDISAEAIKKARKLNEDVKFIQDDILNSHLNVQFDFIFDRGCFHIIPEEKRPEYILQVVNLLKQNGILFLKCFSDKNPDTGFGPYHLSKTSIESLFDKDFNIIKIKDSVYQSTSSRQNNTLFVVMKKLKEIKIGNLRQVFTGVESNFRKFSKYQLGEDFYNFENGDKEKEIEEPTNSILPTKQD